jgi:hypothetical protein
LHTVAGITATAMFERTASLFDHWIGVQRDMVGLSRCCSESGIFSRSQHAEIPTAFVEAITERRVVAKFWGAVRALAISVVNWAHDLDFERELFQCASLDCTDKPDQNRAKEPDV